MATSTAWNAANGWDGWLDVMYPYAWFLSIVPSILAYPAYAIWNLCMNTYLFVDMILKVIGLAFHPASEAYIWTMNNWWYYSFRRWIS